MRYGMVGYRSGGLKQHYGLIYHDGQGNIKLNMMNKSSSFILRKQNKELFNDLVKVLNKYYHLEDLNGKNKTGKICKKNCIKIKKKSLK